MFVGVPTLAVAMACGGGGETPAPADTAATAPATSGAKSLDAATAGTIAGRVTLTGTPPEEQVIRMNADPVCMREAPGSQRTEVFLVGEGGTLGNAFVYIKDGLDGFDFPAATGTVTLDQQGCRYLPHVIGIRTGQTLEIVNSDPTLHNIHAIPANNPEFNTGQPIQGMKTQQTFANSEVMVPFKCDVHSWMNAYAGVVDHPYFAVTDADGTFSLANVPPGTYTIEVWHEKLGTQTQSVTVDASGTADVAVAFTVS
jgi:plastocyanin